MAQVYQTAQQARPIRSVPKPARTPKEMARAEKERQLAEQSGTLYDQLFAAIRDGHGSTAHHVIDRMLALRGEYLDVIATAQSEAGEESQVVHEWEQRRAVA